MQLSKTFADNIIKIVKKFQAPHKDEEDEEEYKETFQQMPPPQPQPNNNMIIIIIVFIILMLIIMKVSDTKPKYRPNQLCAEKLRLLRLANMYQ